MVCCVSLWRWSGSIPATIDTTDGGCRQNVASNSPRLLWVDFCRLLLRSTRRLRCITTVHTEQAVPGIVLSTIKCTVIQSGIGQFLKIHSVQWDNLSAQGSRRSRFRTLGDRHLIISHIILDVSTCRLRPSGHHKSTHVQRVNQLWHLLGCLAECNDPFLTQEKVPIQ